MSVLGFEQLMPIMEMAFEKGKTVTLDAKGRSMIPLLRDGVDRVILAKCEAPTSLKKRALPLYCREDGKYVLHRIVKVSDSGYVMCGDGQWVTEEGIRPEQIRAIAVGFIRNGNHISTHNFSYKLYSFLWCAVLPLRRVFLKIYRIMCAKKGKK